MSQFSTLSINLTFLKVSITTDVIYCLLLEIQDLSQQEFHLPYSSLNDEGESKHLLSI